MLDRLTIRRYTDKHKQQNIMISILKITTKNIIFYYTDKCAVSKEERSRMKKLSPWCKSAKIAMVKKDLSVQELSDNLEMNRSYVSSIINGRVYSPPAVKKISDYLGISDSNSCTV